MKKTKNKTRKIFRIAVLPGDGVGPEVVREGVKILKKTTQKYKHEFEYKYGLIGAEAIEKTGEALGKKTLNLCKKSDAILFGAIGDPKYDNNPNLKVRPEQGLLLLRSKLQLFANLRPVKIFKELINSSPIKKEKIVGTDLLVVRELTGGIYFGKPRTRKDDGKMAIDTCVYTKKEVERIARLGFQQAKKRQKKVTSVDKANVLETSRLWRQTVEDVAKDYHTVSLTHMFVDNMAMQLVKNPKQFDVILTGNMFGDILTDEASVLAGSIGLLPSASVGEKYALYEPIHGSYPKAAGKNIANPIATILSIALMLRISFSLEKEAKNVEEAVEKTLKEGFRTKDIADKNTSKNKILGTEEMGEKIQNYL